MYEYKNFIYIPIFKYFVCGMFIDKYCFTNKLQEILSLWKNANFPILTHMFWWEKLCYVLIRKVLLKLKKGWIAEYIRIIKVEKSHNHRVHFDEK